MLSAAVHDHGSARVRVSSLVRAYLRVCVALGDEALKPSSMPSCRKRDRSDAGDSIPAISTSVPAVRPVQHAEGSSVVFLKLALLRKEEQVGRSLLIPEAFYLGRTCM